MIQYVQRNEESSHLKIIHFYEEENGGIPSELESNAKSMSERPSFPLHATHQSVNLVLDEAFPEITIDLVRFICQLSHQSFVSPDSLLVAASH